jgi:hypothetical protein
MFDTVVGEGGESLSREQRFFFQVPWFAELVRTTR